MTASTKDRRLTKVESAVLELEREAKGGKSTLIRHEVRKLTPREIIKSVREKEGMTQQDFADAFGLSISTVRNWEQGHRAPEISGEILLRLIEKDSAQVKRIVKESRRAES